MPSYVIVETAPRVGETIEATLCDPSVIGVPDRRTDTPVQARLVNERTLAIDGEPRRIISSMGENGVTTFLVDGSTRGVRNRERRVALARASGLLQQFAATLKPLAAGSEELPAEALQTLFDWLAEERQHCAMAAKQRGCRDGLVLLASRRCSAGCKDGSQRPRARRRGAAAEAGPG